MAQIDRADRGTRLAVHARDRGHAGRVRLAVIGHAVRRHHHRGVRLADRVGDVAARVVVVARRVGEGPRVQPRASVRVCRACEVQTAQGHVAYTPRRARRRVRHSVVRHAVAGHADRRVRLRDVDGGSAAGVVVVLLAADGRRRRVMPRVRLRVAVLRQRHAADSSDRHAARMRLHVVSAGVVSNADNCVGLRDRQDAVVGENVVVVEPVIRIAERAGDHVTAGDDIARRGCRGCEGGSDSVVVEHADYRPRQRWQCGAVDLGLIVGGHIQRRLVDRQSARRGRSLEVGVPRITEADRVGGAARIEYVRVERSREMITAVQDRGLGHAVDGNRNRFARDQQAISVGVQNAADNGTGRAIGDRRRAQKAERWRRLQHLENDAGIGVIEGYRIVRREMSGQSVTASAENCPSRWVVGELTGHVCAGI